VKHTRELLFVYWLPVLVMLALIAMESTDTMSGDHTGHWLGRFTLWVGLPLVGPALSLLNLVMRKSGHMLGYALLCLAWLRLLRGSYWLGHEYHRTLRDSIAIPRLWWRIEWGALAVFCTWVVATTDELHQMSIPSRTGCWSDVAIDTGSALVAAALIWLHAQHRCRPAANA
jgi:VanZ family protein